MATISFYAGTTLINNLNGSGLGFYGTGFGSSVNVGEYQDTTFITNSAGNSQGLQCNNIKYQNTMSGIINSASSGVLLTQIPNSLSTLNIRFEHGSAVQVQNVKAYIYDRVSINNDASGVLTKFAEISHLSDIQSNTGSGDVTWLSPNGSGLIVSLNPSPGMSGIYSNGSSTVPSLRHDHYVCISQSPSSVGSKLSALYISLEYL